MGMKIMPTRIIIYAKDVENISVREITLINMKRYSAKKRRPLQNGDGGTYLN